MVKKAGIAASAVIRLTKPLCSLGIKMRISEKRKQALYDAIYDTIMDVRVRQRMDSSMEDLEERDTVLHNAVEDIWNEQKRVLNIVDT